MDNTDNTFQEGEDWRLGKLKDYGKEAYQPFVDLLFKYQDAFIPYLRSLSRGLHAGGDGLSPSDETSEEVDRYVGSLFNETARGVDDLIHLLERKKLEELTAFLNRLSLNRPSLAFSTSYVAGLFIGRLTRHIVTEKKSEPIH